MSMRRFHVPAIILFLALPYAAFLLSGVPEMQTGQRWGLNPTVIMLTLGFIVTGLQVYFHVRFLLMRYVGDLHDLDPADAGDLMMRLLFGLREFPPKSPVLMVQDGQVAPEGPAVLHKVGGPGHLSVGPGNAVVTSRLGILHRVLFPGFHDLGPFERIWDVVDLRPQRRTITVEFMTRDAIPASTVVSVVCRPDLPQSLRMPQVTHEHVQVVLQLTTSKFVRRSGGSDRVSDWVAGIVNGTTDGTVRDVLEQYTLDDFVNPQKWLVGAELPSRITVTPVQLPKLEAEILKEVREVGKSRGIVVEKVELGPVQPSDEAIVRQWLDFWKARLQRDHDEYMLNVEADQTQQILDVQRALQVDFLKRTLDSVERLSEEHKSLPNELIFESILQVVLSMYQGSPEIQHMLFQQGESLVRFVQMILWGPSALQAAGPAGPPIDPKSGGYPGPSRSPSGAPSPPSIEPTPVREIPLDRDKRS